MSTLEQLVENAIHRLDGESDRGPSSERRVVQSQERTRRVDQRTAREPIVDAEVEAGDAAEPRAVPRTPAFSDSADDSEAGGGRMTRPSRGVGQRPHPIRIELDATTP